MSTVELAGDDVLLDEHQEISTRGGLLLLGLYLAVKCIHSPLVGRLVSRECHFSSWLYNCKHVK